MGESGEFVSLEVWSPFYAGEIAERGLTGFVEFCMDLLALSDLDFLVNELY